MPEFPIRDSIITSLNAQEPWPDNVKLYQPYEVEQILLPDNASCLAVQAFLKMCNLHFEVEMRWNAEWMSPSGRVPFIKCGAFVVSELEPIVQFAANKGVSLCSRLATEDKAEMRAYMSLITNVLVNAELYISWLDNETFNAVTKVRNSSVYPWPLGWLQTRAKRNAVAKRLKALHWHDKTLDQVLADVEQCCNSLSQRLGDKDYFFGTSPTPLDALVYGHTRALLSTAGPRAPAAIKPIPTTVHHTPPPPSSPTPLDALVYGHTRALLSTAGPRAPAAIKPIPTTVHHTPPPPSSPTPLDALVYGHTRALLSTAGPRAPAAIKPIPTTVHHTPPPPSSPTPLDALVYGHTRALLSTAGPRAPAAIKPIPTTVHHTPPPPSSPTPLDALVYGHTRALLSTAGPRAPAAIKPIPTTVHHTPPPPSSPTPLDALVYGHTRALLSTAGPRAPAAIKPIPTTVHHTPPPPSSPTPLDALVYGHTRALLSTAGPRAPAAIKPIPTTVHHTPPPPSSPTPLDALVYGHTRALLSTAGPRAPAAIKPIPTTVHHTPPPPSSPTPLDALVYGHTRALLSTAGPRAPAAIKPIPTTVHHTPPPPSSPTPLDALVYGHTRALLSTAGPRAPAAIKPIPTTVHHTPPPPSSPTPLDALVYGHTRALLSTAGPRAPAAIKPIPTTVHHTPPPPSSPTPLDALVYGHTRALLSTAGPRAPAAIKPITTTLLRHAYRVARLTDMKLNCQEEYLVNQAFQLSYRRPAVDRGDSIYRRSRLSLRLPSKDSMSYCRERDNNVFGFKPFASKQIIIMTSNEGTLTCRLDGRKQSSFNSDQISFVIDIIEDLLDRVDEIVFNEKLDAERNDFEVIAFANEFLDSKYGSVGVKSEDYLDPIGLEEEENEQSNELSIDETLIGDGNMEDQVLEDDMIDALADNAQGKTLSSHPTSIKGLSSGTIDTSNKKAALGYTVSSSGDRGSLRTQNLISEVTDKSPDNKSLKSTNSLSSTKSSGFSSESKVTLKIPSDEEISVESLLRCLRKRNAYYASYLDADID